ncbi:MAG TPA: peptidyl-prolyl cis-trans isomerase [Opitutaceae bacterium]|nr:peptidyl-prolyl cis-trans isomerase [Opitutaceae bacterium]
MISWIQKSFQQHFRVVFLVLLAVTIISFIVTIGAAPGLGGAQRRAQAQPFFDLNLSTEEDRKTLYGDAQLSVYLQYGYSGLDEARLQQFAYTRYACLALADQLHIPAPTDTEVTEHIKSMPRFFNESGQFDPKKYSEFRDSIRKDGHTNESSIGRVLADEVRIQRVQKLLGGPGYVLPTEVKKQVEMADTSWTLGVATFDLASYKPTINPTDADLQKFFEANAFRYEIPPQLVLSYIDFPASAYVNQVKVTESDVRAYYDANPARFAKTPNPAEKNPAPANPAADYAAARPQVEAALRLERAQRLAGKAASDFVVALFEHKPAFNSPELGKFFSQRNVSLKDLPPFPEGQSPAALGGDPQITEEAARLNKDRYFSDALPTSTGAVVLFWKDILPKRQPTLAEVKQKVLADYTEDEKSKRFVEVGKTLRTQIAARVKAGDSFEKAVSAAADAQGIKADVKTHPAFTLRQQPQDLDYSVYNILEHLDKGQVSEITRSENKALLVYAADKKAPDVSESNPQYVQTRTQIAQGTAARTGNEYLMELVRAELAKTPRAVD